MGIIVGKRTFLFERWRNQLLSDYSWREWSLQWRVTDSLLVEKVRKREYNRPSLIVSTVMQRRAYFSWRRIYFPSEQKNFKKKLKN